MIVIMVIMIACSLFDHRLIAWDGVSAHLLLISHQTSSVSPVVLGLHPMEASSWSSFSERGGPIPPYTSETTPTSEQSARVLLAKTSEKRELGRERVLSEPAGGASPSRSEGERGSQRVRVYSWKGRPTRANVIAIKFRYVLFIPTVWFD